MKKLLIPAGLVVIGLLLVYIIRTYHDAQSGLPNSYQDAFQNNIIRVTPNEGTIFHTQSNSSFNPKSIVIEGK